MLLAVSKLVLDLFLPVIDLSPNILGWSCVMGAICMSLGWCFYSFRSESLSIETIPSNECMDLVEIIGNIFKRS